MIYYRLAFLTPQTRIWCWKTTVLTSLPTVFHWLRVYHAFPQDQLRIFSSLSKEDLEEMLTAENCGMPSGSVTAEQFLRERLMLVPQGTPSASTQETTEPQSVPPKVPANNESYRMFFLLKKSKGSILDRQRLERESGPGGDHDVPYRFSLPTTLPQLQAWIRLQNRARTETLPVETDPCNTLSRPS